MNMVEEGWETCACVCLFFYQLGTSAGSVGWKVVLFTYSRPSVDCHLASDTKYNI